MISVIIPTYNRGEELKELLSSLGNQTYPRDYFEIIVVDDGSTDGTESTVKSLAKAYGLCLRYFYQENRGPGPSRNLGMAKARGDVFVFIDSDCIASPDWLEQIASAMSTGEIDAFGGRDTFHPDFPVLLKAIDYSMTSFIGTGGTRGRSGLQVARYYPRSFNMGFRREVYEKIGGMRNLRHGQDIEFSNRIHRNGFRVAFLPDVVVFHKRRTSMKRFFKQIFNWGVTRINLGRIDRQMLRPVHALPALAVAVYLLLALGTLHSRYALLTWLGATGLAGFILIFAFIQAALIHRSIRVGALSMVALCVQVIAYGLGFLSGACKMLFSRGQEPVEGFTKHYYD